MRNTAGMETHVEKLAVDIREAAQMLSVSPRTIQNYIAAKLLRARKIGRRTVIPVRVLKLFLLTDHVLPAQVIQASTLRRRSRGA
jgi:excisionase family DNA binding protein